MQYLEKHGNIKIASFHSNAALLDFNQLLLDFFSLDDSKIIFTLL